MYNKIKENDVSYLQNQGLEFLFNKKKLMKTRNNTITLK